MSWERAACRSEDPERFFPVSYQTQLPQIRRTKEICFGCPTLAACRAYVDANPQDDGIWAGLTPRERRETRAAAVSSR